jgi:hypothetical protein
MANVRFEFDPEFDTNVYHASNKTKSSLAPLYNTVRKVTDEIAKEAKSAIQREWYNAESEATSNRKDRFDKNHNSTFLTAKAKSAALKSAYNTVAPIMGVDSEIYGRVVINRTGSSSLEFGGVDPKFEIGRGTGKYITHPAYAFLRTAMRRAG